MDAGERLLKAGRPADAVREADEALARFPGRATATDLKRRAEAEQTRLAQTRELERQQRELDRLTAAAREATQKGDWAGATNSWGQAWRKAQELQNSEQVESSRSELDFALTMAEGERLLSEGQLEGAKQQALRALSQKPGQGAALSLRNRAESSGRQEEDYAHASGALRDGKYEEVLRVANSHPRIERFDALKRQAEEESGALKEATRRFALGDYGFIAALQTQSYSAKSAFSNLLAAGRKEHEQLQELRSLRQANDFPKVRDQLAKLSREVMGKAPFAELADWAAKQGNTSVSTVQTVTTGQPDPAAAARQAVAVHDQLLDHWEVTFGIRRGPRDVRTVRASGLSSALRNFLLTQLNQMEEDYQAVGRLPDRTLKFRIDNLRRIIGGGPPLTAPLLGPRIEPFVAPVPTR
jgi:hypothetical protein